MTTGSRLVFKLLAAQLIVLIIPIVALIAFRSAHLPRAAEEAARAQLRDLAFVLAAGGLPRKLPPGLAVALLPDADTGATGDEDLLAFCRALRDSHELHSGAVLRWRPLEMTTAARGAQGWVIVSEPRSRVIPSLFPHVRRVAMVVRLTLGAAILLNLLFAWSLLRPLRRLRDQAQRLADGEPGADVPEIEGVVQDEVGDIARALNRLVRRLAAQRDALVAYAAESSHRMRTSLAAVRGSAEILREKDVPDAVRERFADRIITETGCMSAALRDTLTLARLESGETRLEPRDVDLAARLREIVDSLSALAKGVSWETIGMDRAFPAWLDAERIDEAIAAIVENAVKYAAPAGRVRLSLARDARGIVISVEDSGCGILPAARERLFDRFFTTGEPLPDGTPASGLGLAIARAIVRLHGGEIAAGASDLGGAAFTITLPG